ncbi:MAG: pyrroloquinoline-quinone synthase PqqC [Gammaproteobacteria bacterium]|nr:pyrroloquinoline-quinone synthase PqqC [Gammaproteobacteria bacterium]MDH3410985.1 pyrroloquinoline-quinone synthase PqqC [Gammaproteobacteria bacterium]
MSLDSPKALETRLRRIGAERYHDKHPFHALMRDGKLSKGQIQAWGLNRYYYQSRIPIKDSVIMSRMTDVETRRIWSQRVLDHDGSHEGQGGIRKWLHLCERLGLDKDYVVSEEGILPSTRFAVDAYVNFVRERSLLEAIASSLTEMFAPSIIAERTSSMLAQYEFVDEDTLSYFTARLSQAPRDADFALDYVKRNASTPELREAVCQALLFKTDILWAQLDALYLAYVDPKMPPPGAFIPKAA